MPDGTSTIPDRETLRRVLTDRRAAELTLDGIVRNNRVTIAIVFPLVGAVTLVASAEGILPDPLAFNPWFVLFGVAVMRLPLISGLAPLIDRRAAAALGVLIAYTYGIEYLGATTGVPYGEFEYVVSLGPMVLETIPVALPLFFIPLVLNSYLLCLLLLGDRASSIAVRVPVIAATVVAVDLVLDPAAVALGFWEFAESDFYGVPWTNFAGWVLSATVATALIDLAFRRTALVDRVKGCPYILDDMVSFVLLWGVINVVYGAWIPVIIAAMFAGALAVTDQFDFPLSVPQILRR